MNNLEELYVNHEIRIKLIEERFNKIDERFDRIESKMDFHFCCILGTIIIFFIIMVTLFGMMFISISKIT